VAGATLETNSSPPELIPRFRCGKVESYLSRVYVSPKCVLLLPSHQHSSPARVREEPRAPVEVNERGFCPYDSPEIGKSLDGSRIAMFLPCKYNLRLLRMLCSIAQVRGSQAPALSLRR
jgi:hypothetical protein